MSLDLPEPVGAQRDVVYLKANGHVVVLGTAGSGKTTMAVWRAVWLANYTPNKSGPTLLVTFNNALVTYLKKGLGAAGSNLTVETYHKFARGYLASQKLIGWNDISSGDPRWSLIQEAVANVRAANPGRTVMERNLRFFADELHWLAGQGIADESQYINERRIGRGLPLLPADRRLVFAVRNEYLRLREAAKKRYDWDDIASAVRRALGTDNGNRRYRHVVVDEGQDFSPEMIRSLAEAVGPDGSLTFFGDYAQQMYGSRLSWKSLGLTVNQVERFEQNYRNTKQIVQLAVALSNMPSFRDDVDLVEPVGPAADGPLPVLMKLRDRQHQYSEAIRLARQLGQSMRVAVLFRNRDQDWHVRMSIPRATRLHKDMTSWPKGAGVFYGTFYAAKGLEFDAVIVPYCNDTLMPDAEELSAHGADEACARESRLLYVAITRARTRLYLMYSEKVTRLLPEATDLYDHTDVS